MMFLHSTKDCVMMNDKVTGEYKTLGDYHRNVDKNWKYYPVYQAKIDFIKRFMAKVPKSAKILDAGSGEGVLVEDLKKDGYDVIGIDLNYASRDVIKGDITKMPFDGEAFDYILCMDVLEHLSFDDQRNALREIRRILKVDGELLLSIPNLGHFASRISFVLTGRLIRTSKDDRHIGDRPICEYIDVLKENEFNIVNRKGIFPTFPVSSLLTYLFPSRVVPLHAILNTLIAYPNICFLNIIICKRA